MNQTLSVEEIERSPLRVDAEEIDPAYDPDGARRAAQHKHFYEKFYGTVEDRHENFMAKQQDLQCGVPVLTSSQLNVASLRQMMEEEERRLALDTARARREADESLERQQAFAATRLYEEAVRARGTRSDGAAGRPQQAHTTSKHTNTDVTGSSQEAAKALTAFQRYHPVEAAKATKATAKAIASATITVQAVEESFFEQDRFRFAVTDRDEDFEYAFFEEQQQQKKAVSEGRMAKMGSRREKAEGTGVGSSSLLPASLLLAQLRQEMASLEIPREEEASVSPTAGEESSCDENDVNRQRNSKKRSVTKGGKLRLKIPLSHPTYPTFDGDLRAQTRQRLSHQESVEKDNHIDSHNNDDSEIIGAETGGSNIEQRMGAIPNVKQDGAAQIEDDAYVYNRNYRVRPPQFSEPQFLSPAPTDLEHAAAVKLCRAREQLTSTSAPTLMAGARQQRKTGHVHNDDDDEETDDDEYGVVDDELSRGGGRANTSKSKKKTLDEAEDNSNQRTKPTISRHHGNNSRQRMIKLAGPSAILTTFGVGRRQTEVDLPTQLRIARHKMLGLNPSDFSQPQQRGEEAPNVSSSSGPSKYNDSHTHSNEKLPPIPNRSLQYRKMLAADDSVAGGSKLQGVAVGPRRKSSLAGALAAAKAAADDAEEAFFHDDDEEDKTAADSSRDKRKPIKKVALALTEKSPHSQLSPSPRELLEGLELTEFEKKLVYGTMPPSQLSQIKRERALRDQPSLGLPQNDSKYVAAAAIEDEARLLAGLAAHVLPSIPVPKAGEGDATSVSKQQQQWQLQQQKADLLAAEQEEAFIDKVEGMWGKRQEALVLQHTAVKSRRLAAEVDAEEALFAVSSDDSDGYDEDVEKEWRSEFTSIIYGACRSLEYRPPRDEDGNVLSPATVSTNMAFYTYSNGYSYAGLASAGGATTQNANNTMSSSSGSGVRAALAIRGGKEASASTDLGVSSPTTLALPPIAKAKEGSVPHPTNNSTSVPRNNDTVEEWFALRKEQKIAKVASVAEDGFERFVRMLKEVSAAAVAAKREELRKQSEGKISVWREGIEKLREEMRKVCGLLLPTTTATTSPAAAPHTLRSSSSSSDKPKTNLTHPILSRPVEDIESDLYALQQQFLQQFDLTTPPDKLPPPPAMDVFTPSEEHMVWDAVRFMFRDCEPLHPKQWLSSASRLVTTLTFSERPPIACVIYVLDAVVGLQFELDQLRVESVRERERLWGNLMLRGGKSSGGPTAVYVSAKTKANNKVTAAIAKKRKENSKAALAEDEGRLFSSDDEGGERYFASLKRISGFNARGSFSSFAAASRRRRSTSRLSTSQGDNEGRKGVGGSPTTATAAAALITAEEFKKQRQQQQEGSSKKAGGRNPLFIDEEGVNMSRDKYDDDNDENNNNNSPPPFAGIVGAGDDPILVSSIRGASMSNMGSSSVNDDDGNNTDDEMEDLDQEVDEEEEEFRLRVEHFESFIDTITSALHPPVDTVAPHFPSCNLIRPHHLFRIERWLSRSSLLVRKRSAVLQALGVSEPTWAQLHVSAGGVDRAVKVPTLTIGDATTAGVEYSHL